MLEDNSCSVISQHVTTTPCPYVSIGGSEVDELSGWVLINNDINSIISAFKLALRLKGDDIGIFESDDEQANISRSLLFSAIITYAKCFAEARGRKIRLNANKVFDKKVIKTHNEIIRFRNKYIAHADKSEHEEVLIRVALNPDLNDKKIITTYHSTRSTSGLGSDKIEEYLKITNILQDYVKTQISKGYTEIQKQLDTMPIEQLYEMATFLDNNYNFVA